MGGAADADAPDLDDKQTSGIPQCVVVGHVELSILTCYQKLRLSFFMQLQGDQEWPRLKRPLSNEILLQEWRASKEKYT